MAQRRMFSPKIIGSARFIKMPLEAQALYFHLGINADDDGIVEAYPVLRMTGVNEDVFRILVGKGFIRVLNDDLVSFILDWHEHNLIRADRKIDSIYKDLLVQVLPDTELITARPRADRGNLNTGQRGRPRKRDVNGTSMGRHRLGKDSIGKDSNNTSEEEIVISSSEGSPTSGDQKKLISIKKKNRRFGSPEVGSLIEKFEIKIGHKLSKVKDQRKAAGTLLKKRGTDYLEIVSIIDWYFDWYIESEESSVIYVSDLIDLVPRYDKLKIRKFRFDTTPEGNSYRQQKEREKRGRLHAVHG